MNTWGRTPGTREMRGALHAAWLAHTKPVSHEPIPQVDEDAGKVPLSERICFEAGRCMCNDEGYLAMEVEEVLRASVFVVGFRAFGFPLVTKSGCTKFTKPRVVSFRVVGFGLRVGL